MDKGKDFGIGAMSEVKVWVGGGWGIGEWKLNRTILERLDASSAVSSDT